LIPSTSTCCVIVNQRHTGGLHAKIKHLNEVAIDSSLTKPGGLGRKGQKTRVHSAESHPNNSKILYFEEQEYQPACNRWQCTLQNKSFTYLVYECYYYVHTTSPVIIKGLADQEFISFLNAIVVNTGVGHDTA